MACWRRLADHVESDFAAAQSLAFDAFLPTLAREQAAAAAAAGEAAAEGPLAGAAGVVKMPAPVDITPAATAATAAAAAVVASPPSDSTASVLRKETGASPMAPSSSQEEEQKQAQPRGTRQTDEEEEEALLLAGDGGWRPPFLGRWPEVWSVSPCSAPADTCPMSPKGGAALFSTETRAVATSNVLLIGGSGRDGGGVAPHSEGGDMRGGGGGAAGFDERRGRGGHHRVLISGRHFAHPVDGRSWKKKTPSSLANPGLGTGSEPQEYAGEGSEVCGARMEHGKEERNGAVGGEKEACGSMIREVFVRFGRDVVRGRVISDTLVEAYAPPREKPGFVDVVMGVAGGGVGGDLVSDAPSSETARARRRCDKLLFCLRQSPVEAKFPLSHTVNCTLFFA